MISSSRVDLVRKCEKNFFCDLNGKTGVYVLQNEWRESSFNFYGIYTKKKTNPVFFFSNCVPAQGAFINSPTDATCNANAYHSYFNILLQHSGPVNTNCLVRQIIAFRAFSYFWLYVVMCSR